MSEEVEIHCACRLSKIDGVVRQTVSNYRTPWFQPWPGYNPPQYTSDKLKGQLLFVDPELRNLNFKPLWNNRNDAGVNRASSTGKYDVKNGVPLNPIGRTGMCGRGVLARWGPNHAANALVTRWKPMPAAERPQYPEARKEVLQFVSVLRSDCNQWAIPGGFIHLNEDPFQATIGKFLEEAINMESPRLRALERERARMFLLACDKKKIYDNYVDDRRNTDNAWIESFVFNFHDPRRSDDDPFPLDAGNDASARCVRWVDIKSNINLYGNHIKFLEMVAEHHLANW